VEILVYILLGFFDLALVVFLIFFFFSFVRPIIKGAPFVPTTKKTLAKMIALAEIKPGMKVADLGSGDGRIVIAAAKAGAQAHGFEVSLPLVFWSRFKIKKGKLGEKAFVYWKSFWRADFSSYDIIMLYGLTNIMKPLSKKLKRELKPGTKIVSNCFELPDWEPEKKEGGVYLYVR